MSNLTRFVAPLVLAPAFAVGTVAATIGPLDGLQTAQEVGPTSEPQPLHRPARLTVVDTPLSSALSELATASGVALAFSPSLLPEETVTCRCEEVEVWEALERLLDTGHLRYSVTGSQVVIERATEESESSARVELVAEEEPSGTEEAKPRRQNGTIRGRVTTEGTGRPLEGVVIRSDIGNLTSLTDASGDYHIEDVSPGRYTLTTHLIGYLSQDQTVVVRADETVTANFTLRVEPISLAGLSVDVETELVTEANVLEFPAARDVISNQLMIERGSLYLEQALTTVPGLFIEDETGTGSKPNIGVRGLDPRRSQWVAILIDDVPIEPGPYGHTGLSIFPYLPERTRQVDVLRGGIAVRHGPNTVGGVMNIMTEPIPKRRTFKVSEAFGGDTYWANDLMFGNTWDDTGVLLEFVNKRGDGFRPNGEFEMYNYNLKLEHQIDPTTRFALSFDGYNEDSGLPGGLSQEAFQQNGVDVTEHPNDFFDGYRYGGSMKVNKLLGAGQSLRVLGFGHRTFRGFGLDRSGGTVIRETPRWFTVLGFEPRYSANLGSANSIAVGGRILIEDVRFERPQYPIDPETGEQSGLATMLRAVNYNTLAWAFYADDQIDLSDKLVFHPGIRVEVIDLKANQVIANDEPVDFVNEQNFVVPLPGASLLYRAGESARFFANYNRAFRAPQFFQMERNPDNIQFQDLKGETSNNFEVGTRLGPASGVYGQFFLFYIYFDNRVDRDPERENIYRNIGATSHAGVESRLVWALGDAIPSLEGAELGATYTFVDAQIESGQFEGNKAPDAPEHRFAWNAKYESPVGFGFTVDGLHVSDAFTDAENTVMSESPSVGKIPSFDVLNAGVFYRNADLNMVVSANVRNLTDEIYFHRDFRGIMPALDRAFVLKVDKIFH